MAVTEYLLSYQFHKVQHIWMSTAWTSWLDELASPLICLGYLCICSKVRSDILIFWLVLKLIISKHANFIIFYCKTIWSRSISLMNFDSLYLVIDQIILTTCQLVLINVLFHINIKSQILKSSNFPTIEQFNYSITSVIQ